jgi:hypothetical protein
MKTYICAFGICVASCLFGIPSAAAVNPAASEPVRLNTLPDLTVSPRNPAYTLNPNCSTGGGALTFHLTVSNIGLAPSAAIPQQEGGVMVQTAVTTGSNAPGALWAASAALPALAAHASVPVDVILMPLSTSSAMAGAHTFGVSINALKTVQESSNANNSTAIPVTVPQNFCPNIAAVSAAHSLAKPPSPKPNFAMQIPHTVIPATANPLPPPTNLTYTNDPTVCKAHIPGLGAALVCPGLMASAVTLPLVWNWQPCANPGCIATPDGYHIYRVTKSFSTLQMIYRGGQTLVDTQPDPTITIRGISPYSKTDCFVVTAFKGSQESAASNEWCGASNLAMGIADVQIYPTITETRVGVTPTACSPNQNIEIDKGPLEEGVGLAWVKGPNYCWPTIVYHGYMGFHANIPGRVWKAVLTVPYFAGECNIKGVVKTSYTTWFTTASMATLQAPRLGEGSTTAYLPTDLSSERDFNLSNELIQEG